MTFPIRSTFKLKDKDEIGKKVAKNCNFAIILEWGDIK